ncbi:MAG: alpha/beta hydrolase family esterase [Paracoccaceae bacterium]
MRALFLFLLMLLPAGAEACGIDQPCLVAGRAYRILPPPDWDGARRLPVLLHFHGHARAGGSVIRNPRIAEPAGRMGLLLVAPTGQDRTWRFWRGDTPDIAFVDAVLADLAEHYPIDRARVIVSGFSFGGAMAWRLACNRGADFAAYLPLAGNLADIDPSQCPGGPARIFHVHGRGDRSMPFPGGRGAAPAAAMALWLGINGADREPMRRAQIGNYDCTEWEGAERVTLCSHPGRHVIPPDWLDRALPPILAELGLRE